MTATYRYNQTFVLPRSVLKIDNFSYKLVSNEITVNPYRLNEVGCHQKCPVLPSNTAKLPQTDLSKGRNIRDLINQKSDSLQ